ncbi:MAG TPA: hypothetical protein VIL28_12655 [Steroidobacteraceae bacterium]
MKNAFLGCAGLTMAMFCAGASAEYRVPRLADGTPDFQGVWTNATATPLERAPALGTRRTYTDEEVAKVEGTARARVENDAKPTDPNLKIGAAASLPPVGNYNQFWTDRGLTVATINGEKRSSIIIDPPDGRIPDRRSEFAASIRRAERAFGGGSLGEAFTGPEGFPIAGQSEEMPRGEEGGFDLAGRADGPEQRSLGERCILGFGSTSGPPMLPTMYNSYYQIVQSPGHVMILVEMVHDARIIRINGKPLPKTIKKWMGDSIGHWEGDTLVVRTTNFRPEQSFRGSTENAVITERFTRVSDDQIVYRFTVEDPAAFTRSFTGELPFTRVDANVYEYACHEGNYALPGILAGARAAEEKAARAQEAKQSR